jgi:hypothetical protein
MSDLRKVSERDVDVAVMVFGEYKDLTYAEAIRGASAKTGYTRKTVYEMARRARNDPRTLARIGASEPPKSEPYAPVVPEGHFIKGVSSFVNVDGVLGQWIKTDTKKQAEYDLIEHIIKGLETRIPQREPIRRVETTSDDTKLSLYPFADFHLGLYATVLDGGANWNLTKAVDTYKRCIDDLVSRTPATDEAIVANVGDFLHVDNGLNKTLSKGNPLDVDGRFYEVASAGMELATYAIDRVLERHNKVQVVWQPGNHDESSSLIFQAALTQIYRSNLRVDILKTFNRIHVMRWNQVALGFTHGDTLKMSELPLLMAVDYPDIWAATKYRVFHTGHIHHRRVEEFKGCDVESHRSPTVKDTWHVDNGYRSKRSISSIIYAPEGEYARNTVNLGV